MKRFCLIFTVLFAYGLVGGLTFAEIADEDILGLWLFDEGEGTVVSDSSGNENHGEIVGELEWVDGVFGKALKYPGTSLNLVMLPDSESLNPTEQITIMAWGWMDDVGGNRRFLQKSTAGNDNQYRLLYEWGNFRFDPGPGVTPKELDTPVFSLQEWHHVAGVYDGSETAIYFDGEKVADQPASGEMIPSPGPIFLGAKWNDPGNPGDYWKGVIDELVVLGRGITAEEVKEAMEGFGEVLSVDAQDKLATAWGSVKSQR